MLIRSQDGKELIVLESILELSIVDNLADSKPIIRCVLNNGTKFSIGEYAIADRCKAVFAEICTWYQYAKECEVTGIGSTQPEFIYYMPKK